MNKFFPVYAAILGVLALLIFLSPQIARLISADAPVQEVQILKNADFKNEALNSQVWVKKASSDLNSVKIVSSTLRLEDQKVDDNINSYTLLSQKVQLNPDKTYHLQITYSTPIFQSSSTASFGIQKNGASSPYALIFPLAQAKDEATVDKYFSLDSTFKDNYFYIFLSGESAINISSIGLYETSQADNITSEASSGNMLPFSVEKAFAITPTPAAQKSSSPVALSASATASSPLASKTPVATSNKQTPSSSDGKTIFYSGWNVIGLSENSSGDIFSSNNLDAYQMLGGKWVNSSNSQTIFARNAGAMVYSSNSSQKAVAIKTTVSQPSLTPSLGWNLLYNTSDQAINDESTFAFSDGKTLAKEYKLKELVSSQKASAEVYLVQSNQNGVTLNKISFPQEAIPAKTVFWFYLIKL